MTKPSKPAQGAGKPPSPKTVRKDRLATALRQNLLRRKAAAACKQPD